MKIHTLLPHEQMIEASKKQIDLFEQTLSAELNKKNYEWAGIFTIFRELLKKAEQNIPLDKTKERQYLIECFQTMFLPYEKDRFKKNISQKKYSPEDEDEKIALHQKEIENYFQKIISSYLALAEQQYWVHQIYAISRGQHEKMLQELKKTCTEFEEKTAAIDTFNISQLIKLKMDMAAVELNYHALAESLRAMPLIEIICLLNQAKINWEQAEQPLLDIFSNKNHLLEEAAKTVKSYFSELDEPNEIKNQLEQWSWYYQVMFLHMKNKIDTRLDDYLFVQKQQKQRQLQLETTALNAKKSIKDKILEAFCCGRASIEAKQPKQAENFSRPPLLPSSGGLFNSFQQVMDDKSSEEKNILHQRF